MKKIIRFIKKYKIKTLEVCFIDILGNSRSVLVPACRVKEIIKNGMFCDGSAIGSCETKSSDLKIIPDKQSFFLLPEENRIIIFADTNYNFDPRKALKEIENQYRSMGTKINFGTELEFYLFEINKHANDGLGYFDAIENNYNAALSQIIEDCKNTPIKIECVHHECGQNQFEINFKYSTPVRTADSLVVLKRIIKSRAKQNGLFACFEPKPIENMSGSGLHVNMSLSTKTKNIFYSKTSKMHLSEIAHKYIGGIIDHIGAITAITNPTQNSYLRLGGGSEAPSMVDMGYADRNSLIRIPKATPKSTRIELRSPDSTCNPYLAFAAILISGQECFCEKPLKLGSTQKLPQSLSEAMSLLKKDKTISQLIPPEFLNRTLE